jgi:hypothetical protein
VLVRASLMRIMSLIRLMRLIKKSPWVMKRGDKFFVRWAKPSEADEVH